MKRLVLTGLAGLVLFLFCVAGEGIGAERMFTGRVVRFDSVSGILSVRAGGAVVSFDASMVTVTGYRAIDDIRKGDLVGVTYTTTGVKVTKNPSVKGGSMGQRAVSPGPASAPQEKAMKSPAAGQGKKEAGMARRLQRRQEKSDGQGFEDADVNKDGKVTPVELSVLIPDITMARFREYDTDRNGCLSLSEFAKAMGKSR
jgi:hypothetical protein